MKILLLGKNGQVGHALCKTLSSLGDVIALDRKQADFEDKDKLNQVLQALPADIIVNAAAYTAVDKAEEEKDRAFQINAKAVEVLADHAKRNGSLLIHYSTDYVFNGKKTMPYSETDLPDPLNVYGESKLAGELLIQQSDCPHLIFRTSWVYSYHGHNFIKTIWRLGKERESLNIVADQFGAPTSADLIADVSTHAIASFYKEAISKGLYHLTASGETSWHGLACYVFQKAHEKKAPIKIQPMNIHPISTEEYPVLAKRPKNSRLNNAKLSKKLGVAMPKWSLHVDRLVDQLIHG